MKFMGAENTRYLEIVGLASDNVVISKPECSSSRLNKQQPLQDNCM